jgi:hypothetical protein
MIAADTMLREFAKSLAGKNKAEIILLADREATRAFRNSLRSCHETHPQSRDWCEYSKALTSLIFYLRHEVKLDKPDHPIRSIFRSIQNNASRRLPLRPSGMHNQVQAH